MPALTQSEAQTRAALLSVDSYQVTLDLTAVPVRSRTVVRFRCAAPGSESFAELTAPLGEYGAVLNATPLRLPAGGRLRLPGLMADNVLIADCELPEASLTRFTDPSGGEYLLAFCYPDGAPGLFCCFDQLDLPAPLTLTLRAPAGWSCVANGDLDERPVPGEAGTWRFAPLRMKPLELAFCAGPLRADGGPVPYPATVPSPRTPGARRALGSRALPPAVPPAIAPAGPVADTATLTSYARDSLAGVTAGYLARFCEIATAAVRHYERELGVPCPYRRCAVVALPDAPFRAACVPGLVLVSEDLLARLADPDDDVAAMIAAHEVAHLWFGCLVGMRWWDDTWLEESLATYLSRWTDAGWASFARSEKPRALRADQLPTTQPVSMPAATIAQAVDRANAITYVKGTAVVRQLAALIGTDAVTRGLADYLTRFAPVGSARLGDLVACWSAAAGRDLAGWADAWLRTAGTPRVGVTLAPAPDGTIASITVTQDLPRPHRLGLALYDRDPEAPAGLDRTPGGGLRLRRTAMVELAGAETQARELAGEPLPAAVFANAGDWALAHVTIDGRSLSALAEAAFDVGDPLTEAACWNAAWQMVQAGRLRAADYAALVVSRLTAADPASPAAGWARRGLALTASAAEVLLGRAVTCAERYVPAAKRAAVRALVADGALRAARLPSVSEPLRRTLLAGFATSAQTGAHLAAVRSLLDGAGGEAGTLTLRATLVRALASHGLASQADLAALVAADPVAGQPLRASCEAARPDPAAKETAWIAALSEQTPQRLARAHAKGIWVPGQEPLLTSYRGRYFSAALPALSERDARGDRSARQLAAALFPVTLDERATLAAAGAVLHRGSQPGGQLTGGIRAVLLEQEAELQTTAAVRLARPSPLTSPGTVSGLARQQPTA